MFFTIKKADDETVIYQFSTPSRAMKRAVKEKHPNDALFLGILVLVAAIVIFFIGFFKLATLPHGNDNEVDQNGVSLEMILYWFPAIICMIVGGTLLGNTIEARRIRRHVAAQKLREFYVTEKDWSFKVMLPIGSLINLSDTVLKSAVDAFFADPDVIKADKLIRKSESDTRKKKSVKEYEAKIRVINLAQAELRMKDRLDHGAIDWLIERRAIVDKEMHPQLQEALNAHDAKRRSLQELTTRTQPS